MCYAKNCSIDSDYPFSTIDDSGKKVCAKKCHKNKPIFGDDKICGDRCINENEVIDYDGKCVSKCDNSYYKYYEDGKCVQKCSEGKKSLKNNTCVENCTNNENFVEGNECRTSCDSGHFQKYNSETKKLYVWRNVIQMSFIMKLVQYIAYINACLNVMQAII
jgi:hypothetical protein